MQDEATMEARRLAANLHGIDADIAESAYAIWLALGSIPNQETLMGCAATLETIEQRLPPGTLAALVRVRLIHLQKLVNAMIDNDTQPPPTAA
ncbi:hypothetical protein LCGC14_0185200 [marine sediment metagenome]|uniref:Uncharacterized protein n=1 Tax=marine sediment metagenome TaxID=412755 RepID=A0A0F9USP8_9ZZZZ|nr:hypothetical protein [Halomonas sp.]HDZ49286.1 hypothetical protein [Halomonas sp.]HEB05133.1 hypothetical protein [Halomonas sp.]